MNAVGLPVGTVTFVFTDVVGSTALWEQAPDVMGPAMTRHDELVEDAVTTAGGMLVRPRGEGDSRFAVFTRASDALAGAVGIQRTLGAEAWATPKPIVVRVSVHTGEADLRDGDYYGSAVNRCARLRSLAHPGQIVVSQAAADLAGHTISLRDLGTHRLKDLSAPEHVHQVEHPDIRSDFPPLVSIDIVPNNLPVQVTELVGRTLEVDEITSRLDTERLVTITGPGGTGKSRLSLAIAAELTGRFPDGVWFVELAAIADPDLVASTVASALGDADDTGEIVPALARRLADKRVLLVLDNCEHVIDGAAKLVDALLRSTTGLRVLATSQEPLNIAGETVYPVSALTPDAALELFAARARAANPAFTLDGPEGDAARAICTRLDGIPLALELAATRTRAMTAAQIAERLDDRFRLLTGGSRTAPERHRTLAAALEWSHDLLPEPEQVLYRRLGAFTGGATLDAIEAVCPAVDGLDPFDLYDLLQNLVDRSLVVLDRNHEPPRYRMLETILAHARTKLPADELHVLRDHHLAHFAGFAEAGEAGLRSNDAGPWLARLLADYDNLRAAFGWALDGGDPQVGLHAASNLLLLWRNVGRLAEPIRWLRALLDAAPDEPSRARGQALRVLSVQLELAGRIDESLVCIDGAVAIAGQIGDAVLEASCLYARGLVLANVSGGRDGLDDHLRSLELYRQLDLSWQTAMMCLSVGELLLEQCRAEEALPYLAEAERRAATEDYTMLRADCALYGVAFLEVGDVERALVQVSGRTQLALEIGEGAVITVATTAEALVVLATGEIGSAARLLLGSAPRLFATEQESTEAFLTAVALCVAATDASEGLWIAAAICGRAESRGRRLSPRIERAISGVETAAREALGDGFDAVWRSGSNASLEDLQARVLATLGAIASPAD